MDEQVGLIGERLKAVREKRGLTQEEFASMMEVEQQQVSRWERGKVHPSDMVLRRMAGLLNVSSDYLLGLVDDSADYRAEQELSPMQSRLLWALDKGLITVALEAFTELSKRGE